MCPRGAEGSLCAQSSTVGEGTPGHFELGVPEQPDPATQSVPIFGRYSHLALTGSRGPAATTLKQKKRRPKPTPGTIDPYRWFTPETL